ncbi:hypothetical protein XENORESO_020501 [Xenotaenia resolanae]|uniref:Uncharacterized protein n=1 Tax=Xenotaenia resolanae TaxID=208358 RepID=A0ABV0VTK9_9TELE
MQCCFSDTFCNKKHKCKSISSVSPLLSMFKPRLKTSDSGKTSGGMSKGKIKSPSSSKAAALKYLSYRSHSDGVSYSSGSRARREFAEMLAPMSGKVFLVQMVLWL